MKIGSKVQLQNIAKKNDRGSYLRCIGSEVLKCLIFWDIRLFSSLKVNRSFA
jgi:hypothetical protein